MGTESPALDDPVEVAGLPEQMLEMNEALVLGVVRQHELTEEAESLNGQLRAEMAQRRLAEEALRESEARFRSLFASAPMAVVACDRDGRIQQYNAHAVELWGREPVRGVERYCGSVRLWLPDGQPLPHDQSPIAQVLRTGVSMLNVEAAVEQPGGIRVAVLLNSAALKDGRGKTVGAITSFVDLTERKRREQQSLRSQRMESLGTLAGGIAHDLNNSLGPIILALDLLRMEERDPAALELITLAESSAQRGADMVRQILSFARGVEGQRKPVLVRQLVREIEKIVADTFLGHVAIQTHIPLGMWTVLGDFTQLYQVLLNLCLNARDAMPAGGTLVISASNQPAEATAAGFRHRPEATSGPYVLIEVADDGIGIPPHAVENIFDPFFTTKEFGKGSGLGLSTSLAIVKSHGGFFDVVTQVGKGTTFQIFLPAHGQAESPPPQPVTVKPPRGNGELILVVDDELPMRVATQLILETFGYQVTLARDGAEAAAIYQQRRTEIAAVITDMTMPVMDGPALIRNLRAARPGLPIVGVSGLASTNYAPQLAELGVHHVLAKPYSAAELLQMLARARRETVAGPGEAASP